MRNLIYRFLKWRVPVSIEREHPQEEKKKKFLTQQNSSKGQPPNPKNCKEDTGPPLAVTLGKRHFWTRTNCKASWGLAFWEILRKTKGHRICVLEQKPTTLFCKGPDSNYFRLCKLYTVVLLKSTTPPQKQPGIQQAWVCSDKTLVMGIKIWISCNFISQNTVLLIPLPMI